MIRFADTVATIILLPPFLLALLIVRVIGGRRAAAGILGINIGRVKRDG